MLLIARPKNISIEYDMIHRYFPHTPDDISCMLERCGMVSLEDLYADVPDSLKLKRDYNVPPMKSEDEVRRYFNDLADSNMQVTCFAGMGFYDHYAPAVISHIIARSEFITAYTPYQPEISQGTLQYIFEYQTMMTELTGLDVSNASMYDGSTAVAEAMMMAVANARKRHRVLVSVTLNPIYIDVIKTYARYHGVQVDFIPEADGVTDLSAMASMLMVGDVAGVILPTPNRYGIIEDFTGVADTVHAYKALMIVTSPASVLGVIKSPGEWGADVAAGEGQSLGMPLSYGGPYLGYMCCTKALMRKLPGRIVGATTDAEGQRTFVLTLQAREQHIRREKATSNICSNQGLMALYAAIYLSLMGSDGLRKVNEISASRAHLMAVKLEDTGLFVPKYPDRPYLNEIAMTYKGTVALDILLSTLCVDYGVLAGVQIDDDTVLFCATERRTVEEIDNLATAITEVHNELKDIDSQL